MKGVKSADEGPSLVLVLAAGLLLRLALFHLPGLGHVSETLERRPELSTPVSSFMSVKEAVHLRSLYRASPESIPKPYQSSNLYLPPVLLATLGPLMSGPDAKATYLRTSLLWSFADVLAGMIIANISTRKRKMSKRTSGQNNNKSNAGIDYQLHIGFLLDSRGGVAAVYLLNPYTIVSCLARSTTSLNSLAVLAAIDSAMAASPLFLAIALSSSILISLYPVLLVPCLILLCAKAAAPSLRDHRKHHQTYSGITAALSFILLMGGLAGGTYLSFVAAEGDWTFASRAYGTILLLPDLSPNIGLWWYFFIEIFDHFRDFFLLAFNVHVASYSIPLTIKYRQDPLFAASALCGFTAVLKSYPTVGDTGLFLSLLSLHPEIFPYLRHPLVTCLLFVYSTVLMPALHYLWLSAGSGNANFYYASTLVWAFAGGAAVLDAMWAWGRWKWELERPAIVMPSPGMKTRRVVQM